MVYCMKCTCCLSRMHFVVLIAVCVCRHKHKSRKRKWFDVRFVAPIYVCVTVLVPLCLCYRIILLQEVQNFFLESVWKCVDSGPRFTHCGLQETCSYPERHGDV